ncbi:MAG: ribose 5-phosphate isomerase B [Planctomycetes bacterium]|nr:ribose 5-phosphate isomerase B [Planctomycetota bacterium]NUQ33651.1 ribose 5-phosphate isomerase B [Planctomycetaceae bacterium]
MNIAIACDHAALELKNQMAEHLRKVGHDVKDHGVKTLDSVDYPDYAKLVVKDVQAGAAQVGVLLCGTGQGMAMAANKAKGIRAALLSDTFSARMAREHNNANVVCFGARVLGPELVRECLDAFLAASFAGGKHEKRVGKIMDMQGC